MTDDIDDDDEERALNIVYFETLEFPPFYLFL